MTSVARATVAPSSSDPVHAIQAQIQERIGGERFDLWFDRKTQLRLAENKLTLETSNAFVANWIRTKLLDDVAAAAAGVLARPVTVDVVVAANAPTPPPRLAHDAPADTAPIACVMAAPKPAPAVSPIALNPKYALDEFVVGPSNQMAYHAAIKVAENPGQQFNPLFIHGSCGLGKTHLLQGICQRFAALHPGKKWLYLTGEQFTNEFLDAIKSHKTDAFRRRIRSAELLVIDDVHFLANKKATQEEFLHTFNQIDAGGRQVVLASDCAPKAINAMAESLISRFVSGMVVRVDSPDLSTRLEILRRRAARNHYQLSDAVLMHVASAPVASVRELEGLLLQAVAGVALGTTTGDAASVASEISQRTVQGRSPLTVERIVTEVAAHFGVGVHALTGSTREKTVSLARAVAFYLARQHTGMSFPELGRAMGGKNHSTAIAACQRVEALAATGELLTWQVNKEARHQAMGDVLHALEAALRRRA